MSGESLLISNVPPCFFDAINHAPDENLRIKLETLLEQSFRVLASPFGVVSSIEVFSPYGCIALGFAHNGITQAAFLSLNGFEYNPTPLADAFLSALPDKVSQECAAGSMEMLGRLRSALATVSPSLYICCCIIPYRPTSGKRMAPSRRLRIDRPSATWAHCNLPLLRGFEDFCLVSEPIPPAVLKLRHIQQTPEILIVTFKTIENAAEHLKAIRSINIEATFFTE